MDSRFTIDIVTFPLPITDNYQPITAKLPRVGTRLAKSCALDHGTPGHVVCANDHHQFRHGRGDLLLSAWRETRPQDIHLLRLHRGNDGASGGNVGRSEYKRRRV